MCFPQSKRVAFVVGSAGAETGLITGNVSRIAELIRPVAAADEELILRGYGLIHSRIKVVKFVLLLSVG